MDRIIQFLASRGINVREAYEEDDQIFVVIYFRDYELVYEVLPDAPIDDLKSLVELIQANLKWEAENSFCF